MRTDKEGPPPRSGHRIAAFGPLIARTERGVTPRWTPILRLVCPLAFPIRPTPKSGRPLARVSRVHCGWWPAHLATTPHPSRDAGSQPGGLSGTGRAQRDPGSQLTASPGSSRSLTRVPGYTHGGSRHSRGTQGLGASSGPAGPSPWEKSAGGSAATGGHTALDSRPCRLAIQQGHAGHTGLRPQPPSTTLARPEPKWSGSRHLPPVRRADRARHHTAPSVLHGFHRGEVARGADPCPPPGS